MSIDHEGADLALAGAGADARSIEDGYRTFMSAYPTGVVVVTSVDANSVPVGFTCCTLISVSLGPPTLLVSINVHSRTLAAIRACGAFGVNLLSSQGRLAAEVFAAPRADRFSAVQWEPAGGFRLPWLTRDAFGFCECVLSEEIRVLGDHALVIGRVIDVHYTADTPLLRGMQQFAAWRPVTDEGVPCAVSSS